MSAPIKPSDAELTRKAHPLSDAALLAIANREFGINDPGLSAELATELLERRVSGQVETTHRHKKRGSEYTLIGIGKMQAESWHQYKGRGEYEGVDMREVAIYRSINDGSLWARPLEEFEDGRFEALKAEADGTKPS